jgi:heme exporter protein D
LKDVTDWSTLAGYGPYVWGAYGVVALAVAAELLGLRLLRRHTGDALREARLLEELKRRERHSARGASR